MSLLRNQPVNPLTQSADHGVNASPEAPDAGHITVEDIGTHPIETNHLPAHYAQSMPAVPTGAMPMFSGPSDGDGFDELETGFGSFPMVKLEAGFFWKDGEKFGTEFVVNMFQNKTIYLHRDLPPNSKNIRVVYSYDNVLTTNGENLAQILNSWRAEGFTPEFEKRSQVAATILEGEDAGEVVLLSIPPTGTRKLAGYRDRMQMSKGLRVSQIRTKISVGEPVTTKDKTVFTPWEFEFAGVMEAAQAA